MSGVINHNLMAASTANSLERSYARLAVSVQRLSSGLRVNGAADDAAGLAIRELMRSNIAALHQGARNANDAISMLQVADGALAIIDEKLIRMKELAEQAATGTYDSTQRLMIDSEFKAMGDEIDRIARATDFNGIKLLDGSLSGEHDGKGLDSTGKMKIHFGSGNDSAEDYYYVEIGNCTTKGLGLHDPIMGGTPGMTPTHGLEWLLDAATIDWDTNTLTLDVPSRIAGATYKSPQAIPGMSGFDFYALPVGLINITATSDNPSPQNTHKPHINLFTKDGTHLTGVNPDIDWEFNTVNDSKVLGYPTGEVSWNKRDSSEVISSLVQGGVLDAGAKYDGRNVIYKKDESISANGATITMITSMNETVNTPEVIFIDKITSDLVFTIGGHDTPGSPNYCNVYSLKIEAEITPELKARILGTTVDTGETELLNIAVQDKAQKALVRLEDAIVSKDTVRAHLGALQNRLENSVSNISIQAGNLEAAESRISDADIAQEMTSFVRNQILTQAGVAMLSQANSLPQMMMNLIAS